MKLSRPLLSLLTGLALLGSPCLTRAQETASTDTGPDPGQICISVGRLLEQGHYSKHKLDETISKRFLSNYLDALDFNHLFFTQKDVDTFNDKYATSIGDDILLGNPDPAFDIYNTYKKRVEDRIAKVKQDIAKADFDFTKNDSIEIDRSKAPWPNWCSPISSSTTTPISARPPPPRSLCSRLSGPSTGSPIGSATRPTSRSGRRSSWSCRGIGRGGPERC